MNTKKSEEQLPENPCLATMKKNVIYGFFLNFRKKKMTKDHLLL